MYHVVTPMWQCLVTRSLGVSEAAAPANHYVQGSQFAAAAAAAPPKHSLKTFNPQTITYYNPAVTYLHPFFTQTTPTYHNTTIMTSSLDQLKAAGTVSLRLLREKEAVGL